LHLRTSHPALHRNEVDFFYFHPSFDENEGERVFAFCRTAGKRLNSPGQVVVVANLGRQSYSSFYLPWQWSAKTEVGSSALGGAASFSWQWANIPLMPGQVRVFQT
jgi:1,4-alpha-glucan branching enzyme